MVLFNAGGDVDANVFQIPLICVTEGMLAYTQGSIARHGHTLLVSAWYILQTHTENSQLPQPLEYLLSSPSTVHEEVHNLNLTIHDSKHLNLKLL